MMTIVNPTDLNLLCCRCWCGRNGWWGGLLLLLKIEKKGVGGGELVFELRSFTFGFHHILRHLICKKDCTGKEKDVGIA